MNRAQRTILVFALVAVLGMLLFPPWIYVYDPPRARRLVKSERPAGYHLLFGSHIPEDQTELATIFGQTPSHYNTPQFFSVRLDGTRLAVQFIGVLIVTLILFLTLGRRSLPPLTSSQNYVTNRSMLEEAKKDQPSGRTEVEGGKRPLTDSERFEDLVRQHAEVLAKQERRPEERPLAETDGDTDLPPTQ